MNSAPIQSKSIQASQGDTLFRCPNCQAEETRYLRDVLLGKWPVCGKCRGVNLRIAITQTTVSNAYREAIAPIDENTGTALRELSREE